MVQLRGKGESGVADSFRHGAHCRSLSDYQPAAEPSVRDRGNAGLSLPQWLPQPLLITIMEVTSWHVPGQTRGLWLAGLTHDTHRPWQPHLLSSFNLPRCQTVGGWASQTGAWCLGSHTVTHPPHNPPTAQASSYPLICPDGKWAYCMWGSQGFVLVNGKLEVFQCIQYSQFTRDDHVSYWLSLEPGGRVC